MLFVVVLVALAGSWSSTRAGQQIPAPEPFFGFPIGADGEMAIDPFDPAFQRAMRACQEELDLEVPGAAGAQ